MNKCARCDQTVYPVEGLRCLDKLWHKGCFKCHECNMTLNLKNYKGFEKRPYCNAHCPQAKATTVADTPEIRRLAENTRIQSQAKYHEDFEKSKGKGFTAIADDPETLRIKNTSKIISNAAYHGELERKKQMEEKRGLSGPEEELLSQRLQQQHISGCNSNTNANNNNNNNAKHQNRMSQSQHDQVATNNQQVLQQQQQQLQKPQQQTNYARDPHSYNNHQVQQPQQQQQLNQRLSQQLVAGDNPVHPQQVAAKHMMQQQQRHQLLARQQQQMMLQQQQLIHQQQQQQNRHSMDSSAPMSRLQSQSILTNNPQQQLHQQQQVIKQQQQIMSPNHMLAQQQQHRIKYLPMNDVAIRQIHNPSPNLENHIPHNILAGPSPLMMNPAQLNGGQRIMSTPNMMIPNNAHQQQQIIRNYGHQMNNLGPMPKQQQQFIQQAQQPRHMMPHQIPANVNYHHHPMQMQAHLINQQSIQQQHQQHQQQPRRVFRAMYDYVANDVDEVSFFENDILIDCVNVDGNWLIGKVARSGQTGMLPANYVAECG